MYRPIQRHLSHGLLLISAAAALMGCNGGTAPTTAPGGDATSPADATAPVSAGDPAAGETAFQTTCATCHGPDAHGLPNLGKDLHNNEFVGGLTDQEVVDFLKVGRPATDPLNTTGVDMPPKGGNPALDDEDLLNIVAYVRSLK
jgi:disulfide bond formation protein DsbB